MNRSLPAKIKSGKRLSPAEGLALLRKGELLDLAALAREARFRHNPEQRVTYVIDTNPNYTNICVNECSFCAFFRRPGDRDAYLLSRDELLRRFRAAAEKGATTVLLQGGINPAIPFSYFLDLIEATRRALPGLHPHFFSPPEIIGMANSSGLAVEEVLESLWAAGLRTIPGGGAEILSDRVKALVSPRKGTSSRWLEVMRAAHRIGFRTTATMMFGHLEDDSEIIAHLEALRLLQDEYGGFRAFIPWSFKPANSPLGAKAGKTASPSRYLRILALSRIYLDNFPHLQASWFSEGKRTGQVALHFGADDLGGILLEENVHRAANFVNSIAEDELVALIHEAGFQAARRDTDYNILS